MENLDFILWMALYPVANAIASYIYEKKRILIGDEKPSDNVYVIVSLTTLMVYIFVAKLIY